MLSSSLFGLSLIVALVSANPPSSRYVLHEKRQHVPSGWSAVRRHDPASTIPLRFSLTQSNLHRLDEFLLNVSHPKSPHYSQHWSPKQIAQTFAPTAEAVDTVRAWLLDSGFESQRIQVAPTRSWVQVNATVGEAEQILQTEYHVYEHDSGITHAGCDAYHLPAHVQPHVDIVSPTVNFVTARRKRESPLERRDTTMSNGPHMFGTLDSILTNTTDCDKHITPFCLRALYDIIYDPLSPSNNTIGVAELSPNSYIHTDLDLFFRGFSDFQPGMVGKNPTLVSIDGGVVQTQSDPANNQESNLDFQYAMILLGPKQDVTLYQVGDLIEGGGFNNLLDALDGSYCTFEGGDDPNFDSIYPDPKPGGFNGPQSCGIAKPANVISVSYGGNEATFSPKYTSRQCAEYGKLGLLGVTLLFSSGDNGVGGNRDLCLNPDGTQTTNGTIFNPTFPSTCPYITSVGATQVNPGSTVSDPEGACEQGIFSSGGFSNRFEIPDYQKEAVGHYFQLHKPDYPPNLYNSSGTSRAFPDLSANGCNYVIAVNGTAALVSGTSASAPVVAAMLTMVNDLRIAVGKNPIGFINPTIYSDLFNGAFNDIQTGGNRGCMTPGFSAVEGWDPVTGLGTPKFPEILTRWLSLP